MQWPRARNADADFRARPFASGSFARPDLPGGIPARLQATLTADIFKPVAFAASVRDAPLAHKGHRVIQWIAHAASWRARRIAPALRLWQLV
jgi:hypothetical protein